MTPNQKPQGRPSAGSVVIRFLGGMVGAGFVSLVGMAVGAACSAVAGDVDSLPFLMILGIAPFAALGARMAWRGVASNSGTSLALWFAGSVVAFIAALFGVGIGHNFISSLPWV